MFLAVSSNISISVVSNLIFRNSSVGIETRYGLEGPGSESRCGRNFPHTSRTAQGSTQPPIQWVPGLFPGVKRPGRGVDHPHPSSAEVKERVEIYLYSPSEPWWHVIWWTLPLPFYHFMFCNTDILPIFKTQTSVSIFFQFWVKYTWFLNMLPLLCCGAHPASWGPPSLQFCRCERTESNNGQPPASSAEVKNDWSYTSTPHPNSSNGVDRYNFMLHWSKVCKASNNHGVA